MFQLKDGVFYLTKGDTAMIPVELFDINGMPIIITSAYTLTLTVRETPETSSPVVFTASNKESGNTEYNIIKIPASKTSGSGIKAGEYSCDIQVSNGGEIYTVFPELTESNKRKLKSVNNWKNFVIVAEVTA